MKTPIERPPAGARLSDRLLSAIPPPLLDPRVWTAFWAVLLCATSILYLLPNAGPPGRMQLDKMAHLIAFGAIGLSSYLAAGRGRPSAPMLISLVMSLLLEWLQGYVPGREYSLLDCAANLVGIAAGFAAGATIRARIARGLGRSA